MEFITSKPSPTLEGMPQEIMTMIMNSAEKSTAPSDVDKHEAPYVLSAQDACNMRLASRRLEQTTLDSFSRRFFTCRKYMISRHSLDALWNIKFHHVFGDYIREIAIGVEGVNPDFAFWLSQDPKEKAMWIAKFGATHKKMLDEQKTFEASNDAVDMLSRIFKSLRGLKHVRIDSFPEGGNKDKCWLDCWGSASILRKMGYYDIEELWRPGYRYGLAREFPQHRHISVALRALLAIKDRHEWTLDLDMPLGDCVNLETLQARREFQFQHISDSPTWKALKVLSLQQCFVQDTFFQDFLERQSQSLEVIVSKNYREGRDNKKGSLALTVTGNEIAQTLARLIDEQCTVGNESGHKVFAWVWFPRSLEEYEELLYKGFRELFMD
ncbi:hypothetical protein K491DRAFT_675529 [Lophiostoma macrostomum CBS 122681]|uniref:Uncharacterized protein n=1 Tax=Lophiostoma macrostomum CBS 122681 TaxID=1314788 RepID=A0A6A6TI16_9PLEO|nr:hypothetical protein K491DRAFT_675529 [Lophiostoma macrostomum CBS 122681]